MDNYIYQIYDGTKWVDLCNCNIRTLNHEASFWENIDPKKCEIRFWSGTEWQLIDCRKPLVCGESITCRGTESLNTDLTDRGVLYIPFTIKEGIKVINVYVSPGSNPHGFSIVDSNKTIKLASLGFVGKSGPIIQGWNVNSLPDPMFIYEYNGISFVTEFDDISITFYGEGVGNPAGQGPMSNTLANSMYVPVNQFPLVTLPGGVVLPPGSPIPSTTSSDFCSTDPMHADTCYLLSYTRTDDTFDEEVFIQIIGGTVENSDWTINYVECLEDVLCLSFLEAGECGNIPGLIQFNSSSCSGLFPGEGCDQLVVYIPVKLTDSQSGFSCDFVPLGIYDGLDVVDICNENVLGGVGMLGDRFNLDSERVNPGTYTYTKKAFYNFDTNQFEVLQNFPDFEMEFKYPNSCINDWDTNQEVGTTTGYENLLGQGDPLPSINEMYLPIRLDNNNNKICDLPGNNARRINFVFNRPAAPPEGYPPEETFLLRVFGHPLQSNTIFTIQDLQCIDINP